MLRSSIFIALTVMLTAGAARADNVDLVTVPGRDHVQLTIYNSEDLTLVREIRHVTLKRGANRLLFSWANTLIDPSSVELRPLEREAEIEVVDTVFPGQKPQFLMWNVESRFDGQAKLEVTYFTSGLTWNMDYVATVDPDEELMDFDGYVQVFNRSGEAYENAEVRLIVGRINLVEKIADLARRKGIPVPAPASVLESELRRESAKLAFAQAAGARDARQRQQVVKEGLSEYFLFSVEGRETIKNGWSKRMRAVDSTDARFDIVYRMRAHQYGPRPVRFFIWQNDPEHGLGASPLPDGRVRLFRENGREGLSFLGEQLVRYVPIQAPIEVNLGPDDLVVYEARKTSTRRDSFQFGRHGEVIGFTVHTDWVDEIRNHRTKPIRFELHRQWSGHVDVASEVETKLFDYRTIEVAFDVAARDKLLYPATVSTRHGQNKSQERIDLR